MTNTPISLTKMLDTQRIFRQKKLQAKYPELFSSGGPPEEYIFELYPFFFDKPQKFYNETVYESALQYLTKYYQQNNGALVSDFVYVADELRSGLLSTAYFSKDIEYTPTNDIDRDAKIRRYWGPWYQNLTEGCFKNVCAPLVLVALRQKNPVATLQGMDMFNRAEKLHAIPNLEIIVEDYDATVRNGCAHAGTALLKNGSIEFRDNKGKKTSWADDEFIDHILSLLDVCNALVFATKVFILRNWLHLSSIFAYEALPLDEREVFFLGELGTRTLKIQSAEVQTIETTQTQVVIEATSDGSSHEQLFIDFFTILQRVPRFYGHVDRAFLNMKNSKRSDLWVAQPMPSLHDWANGVKSYEQLLKDSGFEHIFTPFKHLALMRELTSIQRLAFHDLSQFQGEVKEVLEPDSCLWKIVEVKNQFFLVNRLDVTLVIPENLSKQQVEHVLLQATQYIRENKYRVEKRNKNCPIGYVWLNVFTKEKRPSDMRPDQTFSYYVCRTEWFDERQKEKKLHPILRLPDYVSESDITVQWSIIGTKP